MTLIAIATTTALLGIFLLLKGITRLIQLRLLSSSAYTVSGIALALIGIILVTGTINIASYQRLTHERRAASLHFYQIAPQHYKASLLLNAGHNRQLEIRGDEWQVEAKILKWKGYANLIGLDAHYKLDRLSGRYMDIQQERTAPRTVHALSGEPGVDLWRSARTLPLAHYLVDAYYGSATYLPMADGAAYDVQITQSGLIARPVNAAARTSISGWR